MNLFLSQIQNQFQTKMSFVVQLHQKHGAERQVWRYNVLLKGDLSHMFREKTKAWSTYAENNLYPVNNGENRFFFLIRKLLQANHVLLQTVDRPFIQQHDVNLLHHSVALA